MIRVALALMICASHAAADPFCDALAKLSERQDNPSLFLPGTETVAQCQNALMLGGGVQVHCGWTFDYRAIDAQTAFEQTIAAVTSCLGPSARVTPDQDVNHPDFYDLQTFTTEDNTISVSLKDKGALQQTLVFVRVELR